MQFFFFFFSLTEAQCTKCHGLIQGQATSALNQKFHPRCFTCASCGTELGSTFFERDGNAYCKDHAQESAGICARCGGNIYGKSISAANRYARACLLLA
jgi:hypothetical protein